MALHIHQSREHVHPIHRHMQMSEGYIRNVVDRFNHLAQESPERLNLATVEKIARHVFGEEVNYGALVQEALIDTAKRVKERIDSEKHPYIGLLAGQNMSMPYNPAILTARLERSIG